MKTITVCNLSRDVLRVYEGNIDIHEVNENKVAFVMNGIEYIIRPGGRGIVIVEG